MKPMSVGSFGRPPACVASGAVHACAASPHEDLIICLAETNLRRERQIAAAKLRGVYKGRPPSIDAAKVAARKAEGLGATEIAKRLKVGRASVYRVLAS